MSDGNETAKSRLARLVSRWEARDVAPLATLLVLVVLFAVLDQGFLGWGTFRVLLKQGAALGIVAVGLTFVLICAEIDLAVASVATWTGCFCGWLFMREFAAGPSGSGEYAGWVLVVVLVVPLVSAMLLGTVSGVLTVWSGLPSFIISLAMMYIAMGMARWLTTNEQQAVPALLYALGNGDLKVLGSRLPYSVLLAAAVVVVGHVVLTHTRFGRYVYMTGGNREAARLAGVRTSLIVVSCLAISGFTAGLGGLVTAGRLNSASVLQNADLLLNAVACVVLGGTSLFGGEGSVGRTVVGVLTFRVLQVGLDRMGEIDEYARQLLLGVVLMAALVVNGLLAKQRK